MRTEAPQHGGLFACERYVTEDICESESDEESELEVPQRIVFDTMSEQIRQRAIRMTFGYAKKTVTIGAYTTHYTEDTPEHQKQDFWLGQVTDTNTSERTISILMFYTSKLRNGDIRPVHRGLRTASGDSLQIGVIYRYLVCSTWWQSSRLEVASPNGMYDT